MNNVFRQSGRRLVAFAGWFACAVAIGIICGLTGCAFSWCVTNATGFRTAHSWMVFLLPLSGLIIVYMNIRREVRTSCSHRSMRVSTFLSGRRR